VYTYQVNGTAPCANATATVTVTENTATTWYADADGDGAGDPAVSQLACAQPVGYVANSTDLCPADPNKTAPGACGCGTADVSTTYYADTDGDGAGDPSAPLAGFTCTVPAGYVASNTDGCPNDPNKVAPGACGCGTADVPTTYYADADGDGVGDPNATLAGFTCTVPAGYVTSNTDGCPNDPNKVAPGVCGCGTADTDSDGDGTADCNDGCPNDPNKIAPGICGCGTADTDTDGDGTADCNDGCPNDPDKIAPGVCGCGTADVPTTYYADTDGDGVGDPNAPLAGYACIVPAGYVASNTDGCPNDPNKVAPGQCGCGTADTDSDSDGTADCNDGCPNDPNKIAPGVCGCGTADTDSDGDLTADCNDGCPNDPNKVAPGVCGCGTADVPTTYYADTDGDGLGDVHNSLSGFTCIVPAGYVTNSSDACPSVQGTVGSPCNDNNPFTTNDVLNASCGCSGTPVSCDSWTLVINTDGAGNQTTWSITDANSSFVLASGGPLNSNMTYTTTICVPQNACFRLRVSDSGGNGITGGGYVLRDGLGRRIIDNYGNGGAFTSVSQAIQPFCSPVGNDRLINSDCDVEDRLPNDVIIASENPAVSAQWGVGDQTDDGYEFHFFDPNGGYSRFMFHSHAVTLGQGPANAIRAMKLPLNSMVTLPLPQNTLLNVRVRGRVNGVSMPWGPVCRLKIDVVAANCPATHLLDVPGPTYSCGVTGLMLDGSSRIWAKPVHRVVNGNIVTANRYSFRFENPGEGYVRYFTQPSYCLILTQWATLPLQYGQTYDVTVQASFDGGATWCPAGKTCQISFAAQGHRPRLELDAPAPSIAMWPNPNRGEQLYLTMDGIDATLATVSVDMMDLVGKQIQGSTVPVADGTLNTVLDLQQDLPNGVYLVRITAGERTYTQRLVLQK
ncbi:MAG: T9SS type A sorting domain-containing protein, partial [Bacteroidetes bacterium]|nr:T9SS type A sorting domain-containing protein [Bacteroidota bacterium]